MIRTRHQQGVAVHAFSISIESHPQLSCSAFVSAYPRELGQTPAPTWLTDMLREDASVPVDKPSDIVVVIRDLLRHGGFKPSGRSKPASEYLTRAASRGELRSINAAVDTCNVVSLHTGFPISLIDLDAASPPFSIAVAPAGSSYVFNPAGQEIDLGGLLCLFDSKGPCANAVKDSQRTKTSDSTRRTLSVIWGSATVAAALASATEWYRELVHQLDGATKDVPTETA